MSGFISELKRRNVIRVAIAYGAVSWLLLQVVGLVLPAFDLPVSVLRILVLLIALGFPVALVFSWAYELTPDGFRRESRADSADSIRRLTGRRLELIIIAALLALVFLLLLDRFVLSPRRAIASVATLATSSVAPSIAVLPFVDMSQAGDQQYFSDGISEELLDLLAHVPGLHVAGRTSSFSFKGKHATIAEIGKVLNVATVLEGSVRKSGDRLRVTAQLINVKDGYHLWSQTYDRKLADVFAVQDDIAGAVVDALKLKLLPMQRPSSSRHHVPDFESYNRYLLGRQLLVRNTAHDFVKAREAARQAVAMDPEYAAAYGLLAMAESFVNEHSLGASARAEGFRRAMAAAERAVALDPGLGAAYAARGYVRGSDYWDWDGALSDLRKAIALDPADATNQLRYGYLLAALGRLPEAHAAFVKSSELDARFTPAWEWLGRIAAAQGDYAGARRALQRAHAVDPDFESASYYLGIVALLQGDAGAARAIFEQLDSTSGRALAEHSLGHDAPSQQALDRLVAAHAQDYTYTIATVYAWRGEPDQAFAWLDRAYAMHDGALLYLGYDPLLRSLRTDPRYAALLRKMRLPE